MTKHTVFYILLGIVTLGIVGGIFFFSQNSNTDGAQSVMSFDDCVQAGNPVMESYPRQCRTVDGRLFVEQIEPDAGDNVNNDSEDNGMPLVVFTPLPNQVITSPVSVSGHAVGQWYFEASFPVRVLDANGQELGVVPVQVEGDWMTTAYVPFSGSVSFVEPTTKTGFIVFQKDNPSGLPENDSEVRVPVRFDAIASEEKKPVTLQVYFYNNTLLKPGQDECTTVFPVERTIPYTVGVGKAALEELLSGATESERASGYGSSLNTGVELQTITIDQGTAYVDFSDTLDRGVAGACRVNTIRAQITETLKQFPTVKDVVISIDGKTEGILQP